MAGKIRSNLFIIIFSPNVSLNGAHIKSVFFNGILYGCAFTSKNLSNGINTCLRMVRKVIIKRLFGELDERIFRAGKLVAHQNMIDTFVGRLKCPGKLTIGSLRMVSNPFFDRVLGIFNGNAMLLHSHQSITLESGVNTAP